MMDPPGSDRALDVDGVRRVLDDQFPALDLVSVEYLGSGWEHDVYLVDDAIVFRFPRYAGVAEGLDYDQAVHDLVGSSVGGLLSVPRIAFHGRPSPEFPHRFVGHELIPGLGADDPAVPLSMELASDLGGALTSIHAISPEAARGAGVGVAAGDCEESCLALMRQVHLVPAFRNTAPGPFAWLWGRPDMPPEYAGPPRFIHNDLHGEHIIVNPVSGRLSGIVDWSGSALGDPAIDFSFLLVLRGKAFLDAALESYGLSVDEGFRGRVTFRARVRALGWLTDALRRRIETGRSLGEVENAFGS